MTLSAPKKIRLLIVDDSPVVRRMLSMLLGTDPAIEVVGTAGDPFEAKDQILKLKPDVITLDVEMPRMDGITFLGILMKEYPLPVIVLSSLTTANSPTAMAALENGAVDVMSKPSGSNSVQLLSNQLKEKIKAAAAAKNRLNILKPPSLPRINVSTANIDTKKVILLGASTGGTEALRAVLTALPAEMPGICIVQHIPAVFSKAFANRLNEVCALSVKEAEEGDVVQPGLVLIAPGGYHMQLTSAAGGYRVALTEGPPVWFQRPAVDVLFNSGAKLIGKYAVAALLTGMGKDGAQGLLALKNAGAALTIAQDENSCVVYGMPKAAVDIGAAMQILPLDKIPAALVAATQKVAYAHAQA